MRFLVILLSFAINFELAYGVSWPPVIVVDSSEVLPTVNMAPNPFRKSYKSPFNRLIEATKEHNTIVIIFVEEYLSMEDLSRKDAQGTAYVYLHKALLNNHVRFMPGFENGYKTLTQTLPRKQDNEFTMDSKATTLHLFNRNYRHYYIYFKDLKNLTRIQTLKQHDLMMRDVCFIVRQLLPSKVVVFYTGKRNPVSLTRIEYTEPRYPIFVHPFTFKDGKKWSLLKLGGMYFILQNGKQMEIHDVLTKSVYNDKNMAKNKIDVTIFHSSFNFTFRFRFNDKQWKLVRLRQTNAQEYADFANITDVAAPWGKSFLCSARPIILKTVNIPNLYAFVIQQYQIQIATHDIQEFGKPVFCEENLMKFKEDLDNPYDGADEQTESPLSNDDFIGSPDSDKSYLTPPLITGILLTGIWLSILFYGVYMVMALKTFDKYDDPNKKPLVIKT